jgi:pimeloyl-ACP methyl ester carboxylesterase
METAATRDPRLPAPVTARVRAADGVELAVERWSADGDIELIFLHGFGQNRQAWRSTSAQLQSAGFSGTAVDGRGHGESAWNAPSKRYSMQQFVDDTVHLATSRQRVGAPLPILVGASMGGLLGLLTAGEAQTPIYSALVMVDVTPRWETQGVERILAFMGAHPEGFANLQAAGDAIAAYLPHRRRKTDDELSSLLVQRDDGRWRWHWDPRLLDEVARDVDQYQSRLIAAARNVRIPTLLVSGARSDVVSDATVDEFLALVPHAQHARIADATHMVAGDRNDVFTGAILDFLAAMRPRIASSRGAAP